MGCPAYSSHVPPPVVPADWSDEQKAAYRRGLSEIYRRPPTVRRRGDDAPGLIAFAFGFLFGRSRPH